MPGRAPVPLDRDRTVRLPGHGAAGAAAGQVGLGGVQPVAAPGEHARAEGGVELVAGEGDPVNPQLPHRHRVVRRELGGVQHDPRAVPVRGRGQLADRPDLAGDVGRAGHADQLGALAALRQRRLQRGHRLLRGARRAQVADVQAASAPGQQRGVVLGLEGVDPGVRGHDARQQVQRVGGGPGEHHLVVLAQAEEVGDGGPALLEQVGGQLREVARAPVHAAVVGSVGGDVVPDPLQRGGAGGVVERGVDHLLAADQRDLDLTPEHGQRLAAGGVEGLGVGGGGVRVRGHDYPSRASSGSLAYAEKGGIRACPATGRPRARSSPGSTPPRTEGCRTASQGRCGGDHRLLSLVTCT